MSFRSKASKINAGNYVQVKQEASANQPHIPQFGPFQPKTSTNPINCQQLQTNVTTTKSIKPSCPSKNIMSSTLKRSSTTLVHNPPTSSKPTTTKHYLKALCLSKNIVSSTLKTSCTTIHDPLSSKEPCKETEDPKPTTISEIGLSDEIAKEPCKETEDPKEQDENFSGRGIILPKGSKKVWKSGGKIQWTENINVDPDEIVKVEELKENEPPKLGTMDGTIVGSHVWFLPPETRIIVHFNEYDQPVRKGGLVLIHFLSDLSRDGSFCPLGAQNWKQVDDHYKQKIIKIVWDKFVLPDRKEIRRMLLSHVNIKWKHYKWELQRDYYKPNMTKEKIIENIPDKVIKEQWISLVSYWFSEKFKKLSTLGKRARGLQTHMHTTGSKSYAQWKTEFVKLNQREPSSLEMWKYTHTTKNGGYVERTCTEQFMDVAKSRVEERLCNSKQPREVIETEVFNELMYQEDKSNNRVVGFGHGVTRTHVFGVEAQLRKNKMGSCGATSNDVMGLKSYIMSIEKKHEEVISELQKRNEELEKQNGQILAQLNRFSSILDKFDSNRETTNEMDTEITHKVL